MKLDVNGELHDVDDRHAKTPLLWVLRDVLGVRSVKFGCGGGFCAACTVLVDGKAVKACQQLAGRVQGKVVTAQAAAGAEADAVRDAWYRKNVVQCGYCQPGQICAATALLSADPEPDDLAIDKAMTGNLCRCGTYPRIRAAIHEAADTLKAGRRPAPVPTGDTGGEPVFDVTDPIGAYVTIDPDGTVHVASSQLEMGQGVHTALTTILAEELDVEPASVHVVTVTDTSGRYDNPILGGGLQSTGSSTSLIMFWQRYRQIAAVLRQRLKNAAALRWTVQAEEIEVSAGVLSHPDGHRATVGELAAEAALLPAPLDAQPKQADEYRQVGRDGGPRVDSPGKIWGTAAYTIDVEWPGVLTALVVHPPLFGATLASVEDDAAREMPGVVDVVTISNGVAVVAETFFDAVKGAAALVLEWDNTGAETRGTDQLREEHLQLAREGSGAAVAKSEGDVEAALAAAHTVVESVVDVPYLAHAPMEPHNAACRMREDGVLEVRAGTQSGDVARMVAADVTGLPDDRIEVQTALAGGGFGLRLGAAPSPVSEAVEITQALGFKHPVKVQSSRTEEFKSGQFRPMAAVRVRAGLDATGAITAWDHRVVAQAVAESLPVTGKALFQNGVDILQVVGAIDHPYAFGDQRVEMIHFPTAIPVATWRSIGMVQNVLAIETVLDEIAERLDRDPLELRRDLLVSSPRTLAVLNLAAERSDWFTPLPAGRARGVAVSSGFGTHSALVVEISTDARDQIHLDRIVLVADPGTVVNPDMVRAQLEGGALFGLSAALSGRITLKDGNVVQQNFDGYPIMRMAGTPDIDIHLVPSGDAPGGIGEVAVPTVAPALVNAIASLRGERIRSLPVSTSTKISPTGGIRTRIAHDPSARPAPQENPITAVDIVPTQDGPYKCSGPITIHDHDGREVDVPDGDVYLCRCGASANKPFCDGSHASVAFDGTLNN
ncbi:molybdopterin cofactor-binding domain-containing protein [Streptomyces sp. NBC_00258]|uniref:molybdopterin cofactor-binding domain-containing protein n=1 Tax=Streptomyces sp. NBC_00258 TaxID=2903642 RepID=UPI002E2A607B|nr:molybdopterin cofactor-binding domain-containing protein [Streptomyces sp. NBC_00258]